MRSSANMGDHWNQIGSVLASVMFMYAMFQQYFPYHLRGPIEKYAQRLLGLVNPYIQITFHEFLGERLARSEAYTAIKIYLSGSSSKQAKRLKADIGKDSKNVVLSMDDHEEIPDEYEGVKTWWAASKNTPKSQNFSFYPSSSDERRYYRLTFHRRDREFVIDSYLKHVLDQGKAIAVQNRQRKLYTNGTGETWYGLSKSKWSHVVFEHPSSFRTLAMDFDKKKELMDDLTTFSQSKDYYAKIGKAWKRGYLLYGPPGTGKSSMIAAMANHYDVYDLELTAVKNNSELRKLLIETSSKSIMVIEDIDCPLDLTGQRKKKEPEKDESTEKDPIRKKVEEENSNKDSKVTLSGLLNFIDGLWSACGGERIIVFTTNHIEKLDPALIRRGRMDKHIEMPYCTFEGFKVLAKNYLDIDLHPLFDDIQILLGETEMTTADVAENLMLKTYTKNTEICLEGLIEALKQAKEDAKLKAEKEAKENEEAKEKEVKENESKEKEAKEKEVKEKEAIKDEAKEPESVKDELKKPESVSKNETKEDV